MSYPLRGSGIIDSDVIEDLFEIVKRSRRPADVHLEPKHFFQPSAHFLVTQELALVELFQTPCDLLPEPYVVIDIMLDELLDILIRAAVDFGGNPLKFRFQLRVEVDFHDSRVAVAMRGRGGRLYTGSE